MIYFVEPCTSTFKQIAKDAKDKLYDIMVINFTKPLENIKEFSDEMMATN